MKAVEKHKNAMKSMSCRSKKSCRFLDVKEHTSQGLAGSIFQSVKIAAAKKQPRRAAKAISPAEHLFGRQQVSNFEIHEEKQPGKKTTKKRFQCISLLSHRRNLEKGRKKTNNPVVGRQTRVRMSSRYEIQSTHKIGEQSRAPNSFDEPAPCSTVQIIFQGAAPGSMLAFY